MATKWLEKFIDNLARILRQPPYLLFIFIGGIFVIITLITQKNFEQTWIFFLYSVGGTIWRYAERDFLRESGENKVKIYKWSVRWKLITHIIYHIGNISLFLFLLHYLRFL